MLASLRAKIDIRRFMAVYTACLLASAAWGTGHPARILNGLGIVAIYMAADLLWNRIAGGKWSMPLSAWISGCILAIVALPDPGIAAIAALPLIAATTKRLLHFGKARHVFNPAASALIVASFFVPHAASWWAAAWGSPAIAAVAAVGAFILWRQRRYHTALAFFGAFLPLVAVAYLLSGGAATALLGQLKIQVADGVTLFFATVMLIEPVTSYFSTRRQRTAYGAMVGAFAAGVYGLSLFANINFDPLLAGLLIGNFAASMMFLPNAVKTAAATAG